MSHRIVVGAGAALLFLGPARGVAQPVQPDPHLLRVAAVSPWVDAERSFRLVLKITNNSERALEDVSVGARFHSAVRSRSELRAAIAGQTSGVIGTVRERLEDPVQPGEQRTFDIRRAARELPMRRSGIYPLTAFVSHATGESVHRTLLPVFSRPPPGALNVVLMLPVTRPLVMRPEGVYDTGVLETLQLPELAQQLRALIRPSAAGATVVPSPALLDTLADLANGFARRSPTGTVDVVDSVTPGAARAAEVLDLLRQLARQSAIAAPTYAGADLATLAARGLADDVLNQVSLGRSMIEQHLGKAPSTGLLIPQSRRVDARTVRALAGIGISAYAVDRTSIGTLAREPFRTDQFGPSRPVKIAPSGIETRLLVIDEPLTAAAEAGGQGALVAQSLIAELTSAYFELPLLAPDRVVVVAPRTMPSPVALRAMIEGIASAPWLRMRSASEVVGALPPLGVPVPIVEQPTPDRSFIAAARRARADLRTLSAITTQAPPEHARLDRLVLSAESLAWDTEAGTGTALANAVTRYVRSVFRGISVGRTTITLTSRTGDIPVTVFNQNSFPVFVRLRLESPKVFFPAGSVRTREITPPTERVDIPVETRATGAFPLVVRIETPDGRRLLGRGELILRSTAISSVALSVVGGSAALLMLAWARRSSKRRARARRDRTHR